MAAFTPTQGRYLAYIHAYTCLHGYPPAESEIAMALCVSPPSVNQMMKVLERKGLILRHPGKPRSVQVLLPEDQIPPWNNRKPAQHAASSGRAAPMPPAPPQPAPPQPAPPANLYVFTVFLTEGPVPARFANKRCLRVIEIRGDQTLDHLHQAIFQAFDRTDQHPYEFQLGKRPFDPNGPNYGIPAEPGGEKQPADARTTKLDDLDLKQYRTFGYWFDFGRNWYHQVQLERIEKAIPTVPYPRVIKRVGLSPPQGPRA